jgi:hypothetical protein
MLRLRKFDLRAGARGLKFAGMKRFLENLLPFLYAAPLILILALSQCGCKTTNPTTGQKEYDPVKTETVKAAVEIPIKSAVLRVLQNSPQNSDDIARYLREVGGAFCAVRDAKAFEPAALIQRLNSITAPSVRDPLITDIKNVAVALYQIFYAQRHRADLPADGFALHLSDLLCRCFDQALRDAGKPGTTPP